MPEAKQKSFAESVLARTARTGVDEAAANDAKGHDSGTRERQSNAAAFALEVIFKDGRRKENFPWALYGGHQWIDEGDMECLTVLFGMRVLILRGHHLDPLHVDLAFGKRSSIRQHNSHQVQLLRNENAESLPVIVEIEAHPSYRQIVADIKGDEERDNGSTGKAAR